jgi:hypothetical protein
MDRCYDFKNIFAKKFSEKLVFLAQNEAKLCKILIITLFLRKTPIFAKYCQKSQKIVIITSTPAHPGQQGGNEKERGKKDKP